MFVFAVSWTVALGLLAAWAALQWLRNPTRQSGVRALSGIAVAALVAALTWRWLTL